MSNAKKAKPELILTLDKPRRFAFNLTTLCKAEEITGKSLFRQINWQDLGFKDISLLVWTGLLADDLTLTRDQTNDLIDVHAMGTNYNAIVKFIEGAVDMALPHLSPEEVKAVQAQKKKARGVLDKVTGQTTKEI